MIDSITTSIDDKVLSKRVFDWNKLTNQNTDGGSELIVYHIHDTIQKLTLDTGLSFGKIALIIYLQNQHPIFTVEREEHFKTTNGIVDYTNLDQKFKEVTYLLSSTPKIFKEYQIETKTWGERVFSETHCSIDELLEVIETAEKALKE